MKKVFLIVILAIIAAFTLSSYTNLSFNSSNAKNKIVKKAFAQSFTTNERYEESGFVYNPCSGEWISYSGTFHVLTHVVLNEKQRTAKFTTRTNAQGVSGFGATTGEKYQPNLSQTEHRIEDWNACTITYSFIRNLTFTEAGGGNNYVERYRIKVTYNWCTGEENITRDLIETKCR